ncbi:MAG TPA: ABC transporter permease [Streptosporangiaceae bacterium]|jgi:lipooligosaccharide transport system permease protein
MSSAAGSSAAGSSAAGSSAAGPSGALAVRGAVLRVLPMPLLVTRGSGLGGFGGRGSTRLIERHARAYRRAWILLVSGVFEPLFYLLSIGVGIGGLVGGIRGPGGQLIGFTSFVAPALLATSAMNGAVADSTFNVFFRLKYAKLYDATLATPMRSGDVALGEVGWALIRGGLYAVSFEVVMVAMGLIHSAWSVLVVPAALLIGFAFAGAGMAATTFMRSWQDFEFIMLATLPMFLFSTTFYPLGVYPRAVQVIVECTPLFQGITIMRALTLGGVGPGLLWSVLYLAVMGTAGLLIAGRRIAGLLLG